MKNPTGGGDTTKIGNFGRPFDAGYLEAVLLSRLAAKRNQAEWCTYLLRPSKHKISSAFALVQGTTYIEERWRAKEVKIEYQSEAKFFDDDYYVPRKRW